MADRISLVDYLILDEKPHLIAHECRHCSARYFDRRTACASCFGVEFQDVEIATEGTVSTYTIVATAPPGVTVPYVAAVVDCAGTAVRANLVNVPADPEHVRTGMPVRLTTVPIGTDSAGVEAVGFGFEPA